MVAFTKYMVFVFLNGKIRQVKEVETVRVRLRSVIVESEVGDVFVRLPWIG